MSLSVAERGLRGRAPQRTPPPRNGGGSRKPPAPPRRSAGAILWRDDAQSPLPALACVCGMGIVSILSLNRVFTSPAYLAWAIPATAVGAVFAFAWGRRSLAVSFGALVAVATITLPVLFARDLTAGGFPTTAAWRLVRTLLVSGLSATMNEQAPVPAESRYLIVIWVASLSGGFLGASWIVVGRPLGAALTSLGLLAYAGNVGRGAARDFYGFAAAALFAGFLLIDGRHRIAQWSHPPRAIASAIGVPALAVACVGALVGPFVLAARKPLFELSGALRPRIVIIKPLADVRRQLDQEPPVEVMRVRANSSAYWRLTALDSYTGTEWLLEARPKPVERGGRVPDAEPPTRGEIVVQEYSITSLLAPWLPAAYAAQRVDTPLPFDADLRSSTLLLREETLPGLKYTVTSQVSTSTAPDFPEASGAKPDTSEAAAYFAGVARPIVARAKTPYDQAVAIQNSFRRSFRYDEKVQGGHDLFRLQRFMGERVGYCEQFAAAMTLMLRGLGIEARVGVGFLPGRRAGDGYVVTTKDAHAWVEALIPGAGWMQFDPTPGRGAPPAERPAAPEPVAEQTPPPPPPTAEPTAQPDEPDPAKSGANQGFRFPTRTVLVTLAIAFVASIVPGAKYLRRRARRSADPSSSVLGAYDELVDRVADYGVRTRGQQTQWEHWRRAFGAGRAPGAAPASRVVSAAAGAMFGATASTRADSDRVWSDLRTALKEVSASQTLGKRFRATFDPRTLVRQLFPRRR